jgi:hypothetical protein
MRSVDLSDCKDSIISWSQERIPNAAIISNLHAEFGLIVSPRTLRRRMKEWNIARQYQQYSRKQISLMKIRISVHFLDNFNGAEIQRALEVEGFPQISIRTITRWRWEVGIYRSQSTNIQEATAVELQRVVSQELDSGTIEGYGKGLLQVHFRAMGIHTSWFDCSLISLYTC